MVNINKCECDNHHLHLLLLLLLLNTDKGKPTLIQILIASVVGVVIAALIQFRLRKCQKIVPHIKITDTGQVKLERFHHYVGISYHNMYTTNHAISDPPPPPSSHDLQAFFNLINLNAARQIGFKDRRECPQLVKLASDYARKEEGCEENIYAFFESEMDGDSLFIKLVEEFERCIISYFAFHWSYADLMVSQARNYPPYSPSIFNLNID